MVAAATPTAIGHVAMGQVAIDQVAEPVTIVSRRAVRPAHSAPCWKKGRQLESNSRWGEALSHYEDALREHRGNETLRKRHDLAKLHYSLDRRYHDRSFRKSIGALNSQQALSLYSELLQKTSTHYVDTPAWRQSGCTRYPRYRYRLGEPRIPELQPAATLDRPAGSVAP